MNVLINIAVFFEFLMSHYLGIWKHKYDICENVALDTIIVVTLIYGHAEASD